MMPVAELLRPFRPRPRTRFVRFAGVLALAMVAAACTTTDTSDSSNGDDADKVQGSLIADDQTLGLTADDRLVALRAEFRALEATPAGAAVSWRNPGTGHAGDIRPGPAYQVNTQSCRDYTHTVTADGEPARFQSTACRSPEGEWFIVT
ncbi:RT0821/Lpp0805 family surface protein [Amorphus sp. 3PC139-8]|uniref:RT0821/Lpp0805 family surface protein n=1 Tax=Amorphus sp. 3PC139-8 TaxID=2735676 RepID=UPI00345D067B